MNTKLTLTIESTIIDRAKRYAKVKGQSLSDIVENYLKVIIREERDKENKEEEFTPLVKSLKGSFSAPQEMDYKEELAKRLSDKYL
jgi:hypothetical protein